jgi:hypothetical protein
VRRANSGEDELPDDESEILLPEATRLGDDCRIVGSGDTAQVGRNLGRFGIGLIGRAPLIGARDNSRLSSLETRIESSSAACLLVRFPFAAKRNP